MFYVRIFGEKYQNLFTQEIFYLMSRCFVWDSKADFIIVIVAQVNDVAHGRLVCFLLYMHTKT